MHQRSMVGMGLCLTISFMIAWFGLPNPGIYAADGSDDIANLDLGSLLDNVVLSASRHAQTLQESPANVFIVTRDMMDNYGCHDLADALSLVPGLYITDDYSLGQVGVRGISLSGDFNSHIMVLIDGRPLIEQYGGSTNIDMPGIVLDDIERIEVIKGPASSLYGSNAFLGIINLITRLETTNTLAVNSRYYAGTDLRTVGLRLSRHFSNDFSLQTVAQLTDRRGNRLYFDEFSRLDDSTLFRLDENGYNQYYLGTDDFTWGLAKKGNPRDYVSTHSRLNWRNWYLTLHFSSLNTTVAHSMWGSLFNNSDNRLQERRHFIDAGFDGPLTERLSLMTRFSYNYYRWADYVQYNYYALEDTPPYLPGPIWYDGEFDRSYGGEVKLQWDINDRNILIGGGEVQRHAISQESGEMDAAGENLTVNVIPPDVVENTGWIYNLYVQDEHRFSDRVQAMGGLHFNYHTFTTGRVTPKFALIVKPYQKSSIKLILDQGFRSPSFYEITFDDGEYYIGNTALRPEAITSYELMASHEFPYGLSIDAAVNHSRITDLIQQTIITPDDPAHPGGEYPDEVSQFRNQGRMQGTSFELGLRRNSIYRLSGLVNATYQRLTLEDLPDQTLSTNSPRWLANAAVAYQVVPHRVWASAHANYISSRMLWDGSSLPGVVVANLMARVKNIAGIFELSGGIKNVFDADNRAPLFFDYAPSTSIQSPGRALFITLCTATSW